jgi:hypothetical protein
MTAMGTDSAYTAVSLTDLTRPDGWAPIRRALGVKSFGINAWSGSAAGDVLIGEHEEEFSGHEELYVVISGQATFTVAGSVGWCNAGRTVRGAQLGNQP